MKVYIKNMVSLRCKMIVKGELERLGVGYSIIDLGMVELSQELTSKERAQLKESLLLSGLELMDDKKSEVIEQIKNVVVSMIHYSDEVPRVNYSDYISERLSYNYNYLSHLFSEMKGITIQQFIINHKIERVKELLLYNELNLTEISYKMHYSSVAHLSNQFKKVTGISPSTFKQFQYKRQCNLENV
jgi:AraC-like DNA-binding protein